MTGSSYLLISASQQVSLFLKELPALLEAEYVVQYSLPWLQITLDILLVYCLLSLSELMQVCHTQNKNVPKVLASTALCNTSVTIHHFFFPCRSQIWCFKTNPTQTGESLPELSGRKETSGSFYSGRKIVKSNYCKQTFYRTLKNIPSMTVCGRKRYGWKKKGKSGLTKN